MLPVTELLPVTEMWHCGLLQVMWAPYVFRLPFPFPFNDPLHRAQQVCEAASLSN